MPGTRGRGATAGRQQPMHQFSPHRSFAKEDRRASRHNAGRGPDPHHSLSQSSFAFTDTGAGQSAVPLRVTGLLKVFSIHPSVDSATAVAGACADSGAADPDRDGSAA